MFKISQLKCFEICLLCYAFFMALMNSHYVKFNVIPGFFANFLMIPIIVFSLLNVKSYIPRRGSIFWGFLYLFIYTFILYLLYKNTLYLTFLVMFAAYNIKLSDVLRISSKILFLTMLMIYSGVLMGIISDEEIVRLNVSEYYIAVMEGHSLGFNYYSVPAFYSISFFMYGLFLIKDRTLFYLIPLSLFAVGVYWITVTRLQLVFCAVALLLYILLYRLNLFKIMKCVWKYIAIYGFPVVMLVNYFFFSNRRYSYIYQDELINYIFSGRFSLNAEAFKRYDVNLFGNNIEMNNGEIGEYFYIDSGYVRCLLENGLLFTAFYMVMLSCLFYYYYKTNNVILYIWMMSIMIFSLLNNLFFNLLINPVLIIGFSVMFPKRQVYQINNSYNKLHTNG